MNLNRLMCVSSALVGAFSALVLATVIETALYAHAQSATTTATTTEPMVELRLEKKFSGTQEGLTESQFSFRVSGEGITETVDHGDSIMLPLGEYTIEEIGPDGFEPDLWLVGWYGACEDEDDDDRDATIVIDNPNMTPIECEADNQYQPAVLTIIKKIMGDNATTTPDNFSFTVTAENGDTAAEGEFDEDGTTVLDLPPDTYTVTEDSVPGYTVSYEDCSAIELDKLNATARCTITNTFTGVIDEPDDDDDDTGGGGDDDDEDNGGGGDDDDEDNGGGGNGGDDDDDNDNDNGDDNDNDDGNGNGNGNDDDDDDGSSSRNGRSAGGNADDNPNGLVAGEQTTVIPRGAANAGAGGSQRDGFLEVFWGWMSSLW